MATAAARPKTPTPPATPVPGAPAVTTGSEAEAVGDVTGEVSSPPAVVEAGPSQCQWSPCGWQPTDSVGLGGRLAVSVSLSWCSCSVVTVGAAVSESVGTPDVTSPESVRGPSQCLVTRGKTMLIGEEG